MSELQVSVVLEEKKKLILEEKDFPKCPPIFFFLLKNLTVVVKWVQNIKIASKLNPNFQ